MIFRNITLCVLTGTWGICKDRRHNLTYDFTIPTAHPIFTMSLQRRQRLTEGQKTAIETRFNMGQTHNQIAQCMTLPKSTVSSCLHRIKTRDSTTNLPHTGRPRRTSIQAERMLVRKALIHTRVPLKQLRDITNSDLSIRTMQRRLKEHDIQKHRAAKRARLTEKHAATRFKWAKEHLRWSLDDWRKVGFSDECSVEKSSDPRGIWVFRRPGKRERYRPQNVIAKDSSGGVSLMVWGCFCGDQVSSLAAVRGKANANAYIAILQENLVPFYETLPQNIKDTFIFQQDNARIHIATRTKDWFCTQPFTLMEWPAKSPDMNPIEHLWRCLKAELHKRYPDTATLPGGPERVKATLEVRLQEVWQEIGPERLLRLIASMPSRVLELYQAKGWYTSY